MKAERLMMRSLGARLEAAILVGRTSPIAQG
jgi:hypothetical protein